MARWKILLAWLALLVPIQTACSAADIRPERLLCEYRENPLGIDSLAPRLSWIVSPDRGPDAGACDRRPIGILVASTLDKLAAGQADLWDSRRVESDETIQIGYAGQTLRPGTNVFLESPPLGPPSSRVRGGATRPTWTMGLFGTPEAKADWDWGRPARTERRIQSQAVGKPATGLVGEAKSPSRGPQRRTPSDCPCCDASSIRPSRSAEPSSSVLRPRPL